MVRALQVSELGLALLLVACASTRGPAPLVRQETAGTPQALGPGIIDAWPNSMSFHLTREADVAVVRVWHDHKAQLVYPVRGTTWEVEGVGRKHMPLRFPAGRHRIDLALPIEFVAQHRRVDVPDHYLLLLATEGTLDTIVLNSRLEAIGVPSDTGVAYVQKLASWLAPQSRDAWSAYVVNPCRRIGGVQSCTIYP